MSEFNRSPRETENAREYRGAEEFSAADEQKAYAEAKASDETARQTKKRRQRERSDASSLTRLLTSFAVTAVLVVTVAAAGVFAEKGEAEINSVTVTDTVLYYDVTAEGEDLTVVLYNDFTRRETALLPGENEGSFTGLKPGVKYTLAVMAPSAFGENAVEERDVRMDGFPPPAPVSAFYGVTHGCTCALDGCFHFTMDFEDPNGYYSDFSATLKDAAGNLSACVFSEDLHAEQSIDVDLHAHLLGKTATFTLVYRTSDPSAASPVVTYTAEVKI